MGSNMALMEGGTVYFQMANLLQQLNQHFQRIEFPATATGKLMADGGLLIEATFMLDTNVSYPVAWMPEFSKSGFSKLVQDAQAVMRDKRPIGTVLAERVRALADEVDALTDANPELGEFREGLIEARREYRASLS